MPELSPEQAALKASITKSAAIWAVILGALVGGFAYAMNDEFAQPMRGLIGGGVFVVVAGLIFIWRKKANSAAATCGECGAAFSITRTSREEKVLSSEPKETREAQPDYSTKITTWVEEVIETTDTYTCAKCGDTKTKVSARTEPKDHHEEIEPAPVKEKPAPVAGVVTSTKGKPKATTTSKKSAPKDKGGFVSGGKDK